MQLFEAPSSEAEARGAAIQSIVEGVPSSFRGSAESILAEHGIKEVREDEWYPMQTYLDAYRTIVEDIGEATLKGIGRTTPEQAEWPPGVETPFDGLDSIDDAYRMNHRGDDVGYYEATRVDDDTARVECHTPYPAKYEEGIVEGTASQFTDRPVRTKELDRSNGGATVEFEVQW